MKEITGGKISLSLGSAYPTLHRMERKKLVKGYWGDDSETVRGARRRYYEITGLGERSLGELASLTNLAVARV